jgi:hypothetical protein
MDHPILTALLEALNAHIDARIKAALADHTPEVDLDKLRELVEPIIGNVVDERLSDHCQEYDHDTYDDAVNTIGEYDFEYFLTKDDLGNAVRDEVRELSFTVEVS